MRKNGRIRNSDRDSEQGNEPEGAVRGWTPELGSRIEAVYVRLGGTVAAASKVGSRYEQLGKWRYGRARMPFWVAAKLCELAGVRLDWLGTGEGSMLVSMLNEALADTVIQAEAGNRSTGDDWAVMDREILQLVLAARLAKVYGERAPIEAADEIIRTHDHLISLRRRFAHHLDEDGWRELLRLAGVSDAAEPKPRRE